MQIVDRKYFLFVPARVRVKCSAVKALHHIRDSALFFFQLKIHLPVLHHQRVLLLIHVLAGTMGGTLPVFNAFF